MRSWDNFIRVLRVRMDEGLDISRFKYSRQPGVKLGIVLYKLVRIVIYLVLLGAFTYLYEALAKAGIAEVLPTLSYFFASAVCVLTTIVSINEILTGNEDSEFLLSTPISGFTHVAIMFLTLYVKCLAYVILISGPAGIIYMKYVAGAGFVGYWLEGMLLTSLPLGGIACLAGTVIVLTLAHHPKKEQIQSGITIAILVMGSVIVLFIANRISAILGVVAADSQQMVKDILKLFITNFRFARMYQYAIVEHSVGYMVIFPILSVIWYGVFAFAFGMGYRVMVISFRCPVDYKEYKWKPQKMESAGRSIFKREMDQLLRSKSYLTRSMTGIIVGTMVALSTLVFGPELIVRFVGPMRLPILICLFIGMSNTTYCAFSIEGRRHWITETSPVDDRLMFKGKVLANLIFTVPFAIISGVVLGYTATDNAIYKICYVIIPVLYSVLVAYWGIMVDKRFGDFSKESEQQAMSQGVSYVLGYLPGVIIPIILILI